MKVDHNKNEKSYSTVVSYAYNSSYQENLKYFPPDMQLLATKN